MLQFRIPFGAFFALLCNSTLVETSNSSITNKEAMGLYAELLWMTCRRCADDTSAGKISPQMSPLCHPHVIRTSFAHHPHIVRMRFQPQKSRATALLKRKLAMSVCSPFPLLFIMNSVLVTKVLTF